MYITKIGTKLSQADVNKYMRSNLWHYSSGPDWRGDRAWLAGVQIIGDCPNCGFWIDSYYGCPKCKVA